MEIISYHDVQIKDIVAQLKAGAVIVYPTETTYGLGADATNQQAVDKIFAIKKRQKEKAMLVVVPHHEMIMRYIEWTPTLEKISQKYWPGPFTSVVPIENREDLSTGVVAEDSTLAFRITSHPLAATLSEHLDKPLVSTSANISSHKSPYSIKEVIIMFEKEENKPDIIIDAGELPEALPSTVVRVENEHIEVIRQGEIIINH